MPSKDSAGSSEVFDVRTIRRFVELMNEHDLTEIDLRQGEQRIRMRRGPEVVTLAGATASAAPAASPGLAEEKPASPTKPAEDADAGYVKSPMVGTFYTSANPDSAPFVKVGDQVGPETTVCIVEAMKVFNEIPAGISGKVTACLVENGDA